MTPEYANQLIRENSQLRQKNDETAVYVQKMEDNQDYHLRVIRNQAQQIKQLEFAINRLQDAAIAKVKAVYEYKVAHGIINPVTGEDMQPDDDDWPDNTEPDPPQREKVYASGL